MPKMKMPITIDGMPLMTSSTNASTRRTQPCANSLVYLAVVLLVFSLIANVAAQVIVRRFERQLEGR